MPETNISEQEVDAALERLRDQSADFVDVPERGLEMDDFAVIDFEGSSDGKPISEIAPQASKNLHGGKKFWLHVASDNFLPKFCEQIVGQKPGETRTVTVDFAETSYLKEIARARTFGFMHEVEQLRDAGLIMGGALDNAVVLDEYRVLNSDGLRFADEFIRHKLLDAIGDLYLIGKPLLAAYSAHKSGHALNNKLLRAVLADSTALEEVVFERP